LNQKYVPPKPHGGVEPRGVEGRARAFPEGLPGREGPSRKASPGGKGLPGRPPREGRAFPEGLPGRKGPSREASPGGKGLPPK